MPPCSGHSQSSSPRILLCPNFTRHRLVGAAMFMHISSALSSCFIFFHLSQSQALSRAKLPALVVSNLLSNKQSHVVETSVSFLSARLTCYTYSNWSSSKAYGFATVHKLVVVELFYVHCQCVQYNLYKERQKILNRSDLFQL